jgi:hypothetical protein
MEVKRVYAAEMAVVVADDFVRFQIPALDGLVLTARKEVGMPSGYRQSAYR